MTALSDGHEQLLVMRSLFAHYATNCLIRVTWDGTDQLEIGPFTVAASVDGGKVWFTLASMCARERSVHPKTFRKADTLMRYLRDLGVSEITLPLPPGHSAITAQGGA